MDELKNTILRCMVKDLRDKLCDDELYHTFIDQLIEKNLEFLIATIKEHGTAIWSEEEIAAMNKQTFLDSFFC